MLSTAVLATSMMAAFPFAAEVDFSGFPANGFGVPYSLTLRIEVPPNQFVVVPIMLGSRAEPDDVLGLLSDSLSDPKWDVRVNGLRLTVCGYDGATVSKVEITSTGPKPTVRWVLRTPPNTTQPKR